MANFFIAVGGTGQNVALAYYKLTKLCGYDPAKIYVMDSDCSVSHHQPSFIHLEPIPIEPCIVAGQRESFLKLFNLPNNPDVNAVLSALFTSKELKTPIDDGMFGRPSVGSAAIMDKIVLINNDATPEQGCRFSDKHFANLLMTLQGPGNHNVVICGSSKGGTGAGGVPTLAQYLSKNVDRTRVKIITLYFLRHFNILLPTEKLKYDEIKNEQLKLNAESGMCYMADEINKGVDACVLFGLLEPIDVPYSEAQAQAEIEMFLYLLAGIIGNNVFYADLAEFFPPNPQKIYAYWIPYDEGSKTSNLMVSDIKVYLPNGRSISLDYIPKLAGVTIDFLEIFSNYINPLPKYSLVPSLIVPKKLRQAIYTLKGKHKDKEDVLKAINDDIKGYKTEIENNLKWFERLLRRESDLANQKPLSTVLSPNNNMALTTITGKNYEKTKRQPMGFIRDWVKRTGWNNIVNSPDFVKSLVIGLIRSIDNVFLNNAFEVGVNMAIRPVVLLRPLLSLIDGGPPWSSQGKNLGINTEQRNDFRDRLFRLSTIDASGVPSLFSYPFVVYTRLSAAEEDTFEKFSTLIKGIFLGVISLNDLTNTLGQLATVAQEFKPNFNNFVVLEWKRPWDVSKMSKDEIERKEARFKELGVGIEKDGILRKLAYLLGGIYPDCLVFPGARFEAGEYGDKRELWDSLRNEVQRMENQLGSDIVRALFTLWVNEVENIITLPDGNNGPLWFQMLTQIKNNWITLVQPPVTALDYFTAVISYAEVQVSNQNNNLVKIPIRHITKHIFCEKIIKFVNGKMPDLPVKSEYLTLVDTVNLVGNAYQVTLKNWGGTIAWTPQKFIDGDRASILLWPDFKATDWNVNYVLFYPSDIFGGVNPSLSLINFDGQNTSCIAEIERASTIVAGCVTNQEITHIEVSCDKESVGIFLDNRPYIDAGVGERRISIDFGTAHTALAVWDGVNNNSFTFQDMTVDILDMNYYDQNEFKKFPAWLPTFNGNIKSLPSELMFSSQQAIDPNNLTRPIQCFTIPFYECEKLIRVTISGFKWKEPPMLNGFRGDLVKAYLKMVMCLALANLRRLHNTQNVTIVPTYPLAFDRQRYTDYIAWLDQLINDLITETGMGIQLEVTTAGGLRVLVGESYAAKALYQPAPPTAEFVVDIGGGTTDIALLIGDNILSVDSFRYGGNLFLEHLANRIFPNPTNPVLAFINNCQGDPINIKTIALQRAIRVSGSIRDLFNQFNKSQRTMAEESLYRFFDGLFEYLRLLLSAHNLQNNIFLYLIGNGWRFIEGFSTVPNITSFVEHWFDKKGIKLIANLPRGTEWKEALAIGATTIVEQRAYDPPGNFLDKPVKTINGGKVRVVWNSGNRYFTPTDPIPTDGLGFTSMDNPRFDTTDFIASLPFRPLLATPLDVIAARLNAECLVEMWGITGGGVSLARSVYAKFLEKIYPEFYL